MKACLKKRGSKEGPLKVDIGEIKNISLGGGSNDVRCKEKNCEKCDNLLC